MPDPAYFDVIIIGGGPAGSTAAMLLARAGVKVIVLEKAQFPRFHLGESLLPRNFPLIRELGLEEAVRRDVPHTRKFGAEFANGDGDNICFGFDTGLMPGAETINIERAPFDVVLLNEARASGATVREDIAVKQILKLQEGDVAIVTDEGQEIRGKYLLDASGQGTVLGRHLGTRKGYGGRHLQKVAYFAHFENVKRRPGREGGHPFIVMCEEGWFWLIPIDEHRMSIGLVMGTDITQQAGVPANKMLAWGNGSQPGSHGTRGQRNRAGNQPDHLQFQLHLRAVCRAWILPAGGCRPVPRSDFLFRRMPGNDERARGGYPRASLASRGDFSS